MMRSDYILRLIEQLGQALGSIVALKGKELYRDAMGVIDQALQELFGFDLRTAEALPPETIIDLVRLRSERLDPAAVAEQLIALGTLLREAADLHAAEGNGDARDGDRYRALQVFLSVLDEDAVPSPRAADAVEPLLADLAAYDLPAPTKAQLFRHFERSGQYAKAEDWLFDLIEDDQAPSDTLAQGIAFFERLLAQPDAALEQGDLPRDEVMAGLAQLRAMQE